jgi:signal transduction histidine kinase
MRKIFEPVVLLMNRLRYPQKFALIAFLFSLPVLFFLYLLISEINNDVSIAKKERLGLEFEHAVMRFFQDVQQHRVLAGAVFEGGDSFRAKLLDIQSRIESDIRAIDALDKEHGKKITISAEWVAMKEKWDAVRSLASGIPNTKESFDMHTSLINDALSFMVSIADMSNLTLDREIGGFYLADTAINKLPVNAEYTGLIRGLGMSAIMLPGEITTAEKTHLIVLSGLVKSAVEKINDNMEKVFKTDPALKQKIQMHLQNSNDSISSALKILEGRVINPAEVGIRPEEYFDAFTRAGNAINAFHTTVTSSLEEVLQNRIESLTRKRTFIGYFAALMLLIMSYLFAGNYLSVMDSLSSLIRASQQMGSGDLQAKVSLKATDEMRMLANSFNDMAGRLATAMEELKRSNEELEHFAYSASHDLKAPLLAVGSNLKLYERRYKGKLDAEADRFISDAIKSSIRMEKLISAILAYARVGSQGKPFEEVDCSKSLSAAIKNLKVDVEASGAEIIHDSLPMVTADPVQIIQLFQNLIGNAIKFRGKEKPLIKVSAAGTGKDWVFSIRDNGIGIPAEEIGKVFDIFHRYRSESYQGTGIGLATCKKIVERHSGRIWVESEPGKGSVFYFSVPAGKAKTD